MDAKELIEQGDIHLKKEEFPQAFSCYHKAHMQNNPYGTYKLAECFRIAFHMQNLDNIDYSKCREYARNAIKLYSISYKRLERYEDSLIIYRKRLRDDILINIIFLKRLLNDSNCDFSEEAQLMQRFQKNVNEYKAFPNNNLAFFLSADIHLNTILLLQITNNEDAENYLRIAASAKAYKHAESETLHTLEADAIIGGLISANNLGARFDITYYSSHLKIDSHIQRPNNNIIPDFWSDVVCPKWYIDMSSTPYETESSCAEEDYCYDDGPDDINDAYDYYYNDDHDGYGEDY